MKFVIAICLLSIVLAEPPVSDNYSSPNPSYSNDHGLSSGSQRTLSHVYGLPQQQYRNSRRRNTLTAEYGLPTDKSGSKPSSSYGLPTSRISQEYGVPNTRSSILESFSKDSIEYGTPQSQNYPSEIYGAPSSKSGLYQGSISTQNAQSYAANHLPSSQYGAPDFRTPSKQYGLPSQSFSSSTSSKKPLRNQFQVKQSLPQEYGLLSSRNNDISQSFNSPKTSLKSYSSRDLLQSYGAPKTNPIQNNAPFSTSYGVPDSIVTSDYSQDVKSAHQTYEGPSGRDLLETYGAPSAGSSFEQYRAQSKSSDSKTNAVAASYHFGRSSLPTNYGAPSVTGPMPSHHYGVPEQYNTLSNDGYGYARNGLEDHDEEPASYDFGYKVNDYITGSDFGHTESRQDNRAEGTYFVVLPDGNKQVVEYEADERGFKPRISVEPVEGSAFGGYDDNAADLTKSEDGPY